MLTNAQLTAGRFAKLAKGKRLLARMNAAWNAGGFVRISTATRYSDIKPKNRDLICMGKSGSLYMKAGKRFDCIDFCNVQFSA